MSWPRKGLYRHRPQHRGGPHAAGPRSCGGCRSPRRANGRAPQRRGVFPFFPPIKKGPTKPVQHHRRDGVFLAVLAARHLAAAWRPPSSPCKPHVSDTTPNRAFLRGFSATQFPDFGLCRRSRILVAVFGALSPHLKIPFPAVGLEREVRPRFAPGIRDRGRALQLFRIESSASNCRLHSVGGSRSRSMPMPRGRRPSTAALIRLGARKASEMVILTCRTLHFSRVQS